MRKHLVLLVFGLASVAYAWAQDSSPDSDQSRPGRPRGGFGGPIELGPDDKQTHPDPPASIVEARDDIPHGKLEMIEYDSKTVGTTRKMNVYTPPGYSADKKYPVLYLLHGIGGDETEWQRFAAPEILFDNLIADGKAVPMIVVMPNGRAQKNDRAEGNVMESAPAFATFERDLLDDVIPAIESRYSVQRDRKHRALAGLSMGGGQSLNFGLTHLETFAWVGGFSSAPNTKAPDELIPEPAKTKEQLELLWLSCGNKDGLIRISQRLQRYLKENGVPHIWNVDSYGHDPTHWRNNLYHFAQLLFQESAVDKSDAPEAAATPQETPQETPPPEPAPSQDDILGIDRVIKDAFRDSFLIGMAGDLPSRYSDAELSLAAVHFAAITPENCMKPERIHPVEDRWQFQQSDALVEWARKNRMTIHGHTLVWHAQTPDWFFADGTEEGIKQRMREHIHTLVGRYRGQLQSWDVVNEAISDGGDAETAQTENLRNSNWLQSLGPEYLTLAFKYAYEADPDAVLYYNDYNIESGPKHASSMVLLKRLLKDGAPIHGVGIQGHWRSGRVSFDDIEQAISDYASLGLKVSISELDVTIRGESGGQFGGNVARRGFRSSTPPSTEDLNTQADDYAKLFAIFKKHEGVIERITVWGLNDRRTWRRGQHPLLFDASNNPKPAYAAIVNVAEAADADESSVSPNQITVEDGGRGPYAAIVTESPSLVGMTIYRPLDLSPFGSEKKLPILLWGNGACANTTAEHKNFLNEIASHGYVVLGIGLLHQLETPGETSRQRTDSSQLIAALDWIISENARTGSVFSGKVDTAKVAAMGMSCGGLQAIEISSDPRITTTVVCNSGVLPSPSPRPAMPNLTKDDLGKFHGPVLYIMGGPSDIAYKNAMDDYSRVDHVPIVMTNLDVGHGGTFRQPHGGEFSRVALAWLDWQLKHNKEAANMFLSEDSQLKRDGKWTIEAKNESR